MNTDYETLRKNEVFFLVFFIYLWIMEPHKLYEIISRDTTYHRSQAWDEAFKLYNKNHDRKVRPGCGSCVPIVKNWLRDYVS